MSLRSFIRRFGMNSHPLWVVLAVGLSGVASAHEHAHVHGLARLDVAIESNKLTLQLNSPLDSFLGFEHSPRTDAQKLAAQNLLQQLKQNSQWAQPDTSAACVRDSQEVDAPILTQTQATEKHTGKHADLSFSISFTCANIDKLNVIQLGFFKAFHRLEKIQIQVATPKVQFKQTLKRPAEILKLSR